MDAEERARREALRRVLAGELVAEVAGALGRTERWVFKWLSRYDPTEEGWARSRSRATETIANRTDPKLEALVVQVRERLQANPWAQVGAIAWELSKLGLRPLPELRTIERILARAGVPRRERRSRYAPKGTPYPAQAAYGPNDCQEADLIGPRYLAGGVLFYVLAAVDLGRHAAARELRPSKSDAATAASLILVWGRLGIPARRKLDNWLLSGGHLPAVVRLCLALGVVPVFIPFAEPPLTG